MTIIVFFVVKKTIDNVNNLGKIFFTAKIQEYELEKEKNEKKENEESENVKVNHLHEETNNSKHLIYVENKFNYEVDDIFKLAKLVDEKFYVNSKKVIEEFIQKNGCTNFDNRYKSLINIKNKLKDEKIYEILTSNIDEISNIINNEDKEILNEYLLYNEKFNFYDFVNYIDNEITKVDPTIYVFVGNQKENYNYIDKRVKTLYKDTIYKGIIIVYQNRMYDYSLSQ